MRYASKKVDLIFMLVIKGVKRQSYQKKHYLSSAIHSTQYQRQTFFVFSQISPKKDTESCSLETDPAISMYTLLGKTPNHREKQSQVEVLVLNKFGGRISTANKTRTNFRLNCVLNESAADTVRWTQNDTTFSLFGDL